MRLLSMLTLLLVVFAGVHAQDEAPTTTAAIEIENTTPAPQEEYINMPSNWQKIKADKKVDFLFGAVERGDLPLAQEMIEDVDNAYYKHDKDGETLLTLAIREGQFEMVKWICEDAVINLANEDGETPLTLAIKKQNTAIIDLVMERAKADLPNAYDETPLTLAIQYGYDAAFLNALLKRGANPNRLANGVTPLSAAVAKENVALAAMLVRHGAEPGRANKNGEIPLYQAVELDHSVLAGLLLYRSAEPGADANWATPNGVNLLNMAISQENLALARVLAEGGADINATDYMENTALHLAAERGMNEMVTLLLAQGALIDIPNILGTTPIMAAAQRGHTSIAETLVQAGANPDARDYAGIAANDYGTYSVQFSDTFIQEEVDFLLEEATLDE